MRHWDVPSKAIVREAQHSTVVTDLQRIMQVLWRLVLLLLAQLKFGICVRATFRNTNILSRFSLHILPAMVSKQSSFPNKIRQTYWNRSIA